MKIVFCLSFQFLWLITYVFSQSHCKERNDIVGEVRFDRSKDKALLLYMGAGHLEPYLSGSNQLRRCFASSLSLGDFNAAFFCAAHAVQFSIISAEKDLTSLLKEIDYYLLLLETYKSELAKKFILCYRETVATLIDKGETTGIDAKISYADVCDLGPRNKLQELFHFHSVFRYYWLGYTERCHHYIQESLAIAKKDSFFIVIIKFYQGKETQKLCSFERLFHQELSNTLPFIAAGLTLLDMIKKKKNYSKTVEIDKIIASIKVAASHAETNFRNRLELLEAERYGLAANHESIVALHAYNKSIISSQKAGFLHEQGLACEKAGLYCKRMKDNENSLAYFNQALDCYEKWGSSVKVEFIRKELGKLA